MPREQTRGSGVLENALLLRCRDNTRAPRADTERWSAIKTRDELLFALELLFIIRPGAPDHGAAGNSGFVERQMVTTVFSLFSGTWRR